MPAPRRSAALGLAVFAVLVMMSGAASAQVETPGEGATANLFAFVLAMSLAIGLAVEFLILAAVVKFRKRKGHSEPPRNPKVHDTRLEAAWTIIPAIILVLVTVATFPVLQVTDTIPENPDVIVRVTGQQWFWQFEVDDQKGNVTRTVGEFTLKQNQVVVLEITSRQVNNRPVIHSLFIPDFAFKIDAVPGRINLGWFKVEMPGDYIIRCAEFCGLQHALMTATLHVEPA